MKTIYKGFEIFHSEKESESCMVYDHRPVLFEKIFGREFFFTSLKDGKKWVDMVA